MEAQLGLGDSGTVPSHHAVNDGDASVRVGASFGGADLCHRARGWWPSPQRALGKGPGWVARPLSLSPPRCSPAALPALGGVGAGGCGAAGTASATLLGGDRGETARSATVGRASKGARTGAAGEGRLAAGLSEQQEIFLGRGPPLTRCEAGALPYAVERESPCFGRGRLWQRGRPRRRAPRPVPA